MTSGRARRRIARGLPRALDDVVERRLAVRREHRHASVAELLEALERAWDSSVRSAEEPSRRSGSDARPIGVLLVDDDGGVRAVIAALLEQAGFEVVATGSALQAVSMVERRSFDVVLSDVRMPGMSGMQLLQLVRARRPEMPVVLMSGHATVPLAVDAVRAGAANVLLSRSHVAWPRLTGLQTRRTLVLCPDA